MNNGRRVYYLDESRPKQQSLLVCHTCRLHETAEIPNKTDREAYLYCGSCGSKDVTAFLDIDWELAPAAAHSKKSWVILQKHLKKL